MVVDTDGRPIAGARLKSASSLAPVDVQTDASGAFAFTYPLSLANVNVARVTVGAPGYEAHDVAWRSSPDPVILRVVMQRTIVVEAGTEVTVELTANDLGYYVGEPYDSDYCGPCKLIRIGRESVNPGTRVTLRWAGDDALQMWASNGLDVRKAEADGERSQVIILGSADAIYVGLPLGADHKLQPLTAPARLQLSVE